MLPAKSYRVPFHGEGLTDSILLAGAIGGAVGGAGSLLPCRIAGLVRPGADRMLIAGAVVLAGVGAVGLSLTNIGAGTNLGLPPLYTPWQLAFAYVLARTLRS